MSDAPSREEWIKRFEAVGQAQARYLWILLVAMLFYLALLNSTEQTVTVPIVDLRLNSQAILAAGGATLSFLVIAVSGSLREWGTVIKKVYGESWQKYAETHDMHPTMFDFAHYTVRDRGKVLDTAAYFLFYPTFLALAIVEAASLLLWLTRNPAPAKPLFLAIGFVFWVWATLLVVDTWTARIKRKARELRSG